MATRTGETSRSARRAVRVSAAQKELPPRAAELRYRTVTEFVLDVASREAVAQRADGLGRKRRSRRLFVTTETLENDIAALARTGESSHPATG